MPQRDVLLRWIEEIARVVARLLHGPGPIDFDLAADQVEAALEQHLGAVAPLIARLDVPSGATLLRDPDRIFGYARLLALLGAVRHAQGRPDAVTTHRRALAFAREAISRDPDPPSDWRDWLTEAERWPPA